MKKSYTISREIAIKIAMNHNHISREIAEKYTNSELAEIIKQVLKNYKSKLKI